MTTPEDPQYDINWWLKSVCQGYLQGTDYGIEPQLNENPIVLNDPDILQFSILQTCRLAYVEWMSLDTVSGLMHICPDREHKMFLATQALDEARHAEIMDHRLSEFGVAADRRDELIRAQGHDSLRGYWQLEQELIDKKDFTGAIFSQNVVTEAISFTLFSMLRKAGRLMSARSASLMDYVIMDESRHVGFGERLVRGILRDKPEEKSKLEKLGKQTMELVVNYFYQWVGTECELMRKIKEYPAIAEQWQYEGIGVAASNDDIARKVIGKLNDDFKRRMSRLGLEYSSVY